MIPGVLPATTSPIFAAQPQVRAKPVKVFFFPNKAVFTSLSWYALN
jgi:hypothetical protein